MKSTFTTKSLLALAVASASFLATSTGVYAVSPSALKGATSAYEAYAAASSEAKTALAEVVSRGRNPTTGATSGALRDLTSAYRGAGKVIPVGEINASNLGKLLADLDGIASAAAVSQGIAALIGEIETQLAGKDQLSELTLSTFAEKSVVNFAKVNSSVNSGTASASSSPTSLNVTARAKIIASAQTGCKLSKSPASRKVCDESISAFVTVVKTVPEAFAEKAAECLPSNPNDPSQGMLLADTPAQRVVLETFAGALGKSGNAAKAATSSSAFASMQREYASSGMSTEEMQCRIQAGLEVEHCAVRALQEGFSPRTDCKIPGLAAVGQ